MYKYILLSLAIMFSTVSLHSQDREHRLDSLMRSGVALHNAGDYRGAIKLYEETLKEYPGESVIHYEMAVSYFAFGYYQKALEHINRVNSPNNEYGEEAVLLKSAILEALYRYDEAQKLLKAGIDKYGANCLLYYNLAHIYFKEEKDNQSILYLIEAINANPSHANSHFLMGRIFSKYAKKSEGMLAFYYFLLLEPNSAKSKISLKLIDNLIALGVTKNDNDSIKAQIYITPDTTNIFSESDLYLSLMAANTHASHFDANTDDELFISQTVAFFSLIEKTIRDNQQSNNFLLNFYGKFFIDLHKAKQTETFCRYIRQSISKSSIDWLKTHPREVKEFENWLNSYYSAK